MLKSATLGAVALVATGGMASAAHVTMYDLSFTVLNSNGMEAGASGLVTRDGVSDDSPADTIAVSILGFGFEEGLHVGHFHGFRDQPGRDAMTPVPGDDLDGDGFIELTEGAPIYGGILASFDPVQVGADGVYKLEQEFSAVDVLSGGLDLANLEVVLHGLSTSFEPIDIVAGLGGDVNQDAPVGAPIYNTLLPFMSSEVMPQDDGVSAVPLPAAAWLLLAGLGGLGALKRKRA